ncbi:MAG: ABC transporter substrate-binding protein [Ignavibacteriae bacterium]|nr:ABC transporter substrate-binding protein [Ignavibacteriota bacterium]
MKKISMYLFCIICFLLILSMNSCTNGKRSNEKILVGVVAPLSGPNAHYGEILKNGFDLAFSKDSLYGLKYEDSKFESNSSISAINKLISVDKVKIVLGEVSSDNTLAIAPIAEKNKVILFSTIASTDKLQYAGEYIFRNIPRNKIQGITAAEFIINKLNIKSVAVFGQNSEYGVNITSSFKEHFVNLGGEIKFEGSFLEGNKDFRTQLIKIKESGARALFIPGNENEPAIILKQAKELNLNIPIMGGDGSSTDNLIKMAGNSSEGFYCTNVLVDKSLDFYVKYRDEFFKKYNKEPGAYDAYAYEGAMIILEALKNVGNDADKVKEYLYTHTFKSMTGDLKFDKDGEVNRLWGVYQILNGKFVEVK